MTEKDRFGGDWLITEYVYDPDGTFRGEVAQRRIVEPAGKTRLLVTQQCRPSPELADHPMAAFAGEWVFDLEITGDQRRYLGPDVVGFGTVWQPGALTGQGLWPRFGYEFESYSVLVAPDRQLTGGFFSIAGRSVADIVGVAVPEASGEEPRLDLSAPVPNPDGHWPLRRSAGPMLVAAHQPSPTHHRRLWAMRDPIRATGIEITEDVNGGDRSVSVVVD
ncbi:hypothetical protein [Candidatus Poriferisocius sp.]|uniref:hypothetical protein n=1 Tax=Candidatus Poriferisocius sp. TaxID=3101276 RepID=UPI003B518DA7